VVLTAGDVNCLKVPEGLSDHEALFLTDILPTAWHANEMGEVHEGDVVAIWGAGPGESRRGHRVRSLTQLLTVAVV
jgi:threonine dehydrogenase-like Zn-dependent dehydrogenase